MASMARPGSVARFLCIFGIIGLPLTTEIAPGQEESKPEEAIPDSVPAQEPQAPESPALPKPPPGIGADRQVLDSMQFVLEKGVLKGVAKDHVEGTFYALMPLSEAGKLKKKAPPPNLYLIVDPRLSKSEALRQWGHDPQKVVVELKAYAVKIPGEEGDEATAVYHVRKFKFKTPVPRESAAP